MATLYFDNLHKQLYAVEGSHESTPSLNSDIVTFGLSDLVELPGQSTWYIRSILFKVTGYAELGVSPDTTIRFNGGIVSRDIAAVHYPNIDDYQDVAGWPLKGVYTEMQVQNTAQANSFSFQKLYKPSKNLTLNREQNIHATIQCVNGNDLVSRIMIYVHAERGD
jgi:hypothetical protein